MSFQVGDVVEWTSQAGGYKKTRRGKIMFLVPGGRHPRTIVSPECVPAGTKYTSPRKEDSYLVLVGNKLRYYWPRVKHLKLVENVDMRVIQRFKNWADHEPADTSEYAIIRPTEHNPKAWVTIGHIYGESNAREVAEKLGARFQKEGEM
jgi:hypothetical protein